ncbi:hypothetical protein GCM10020000_77390 [Streptomyces olivoverticillatus]
MPPTLGAVAERMFVANRVHVGASRYRQSTRAVDMAADQIAAGMAIRDCP